ncbi:phosphatase PAP2 family protein [Sphingomonas sp.]|uniref:phosphatase PAP2 family protein n=1 Tax=Sphingomonas sp. TaxID=28214 RepID=UPI003B3A5A35
MTSPWSSPRAASALAGALLTLGGLAIWLLHAAVDRPLLAWLRIGAPHPLLAVATFSTHGGGAAALSPGARAGVALLALAGRRREALWLFATIASGRLLVEGLKGLIGRTRPDAAGRLVEVSSASFPSSHSAGAMLTVAAILAVLRPPPPIAIVALSWPLLVGLSRLVLGVHWPSDVLAGWGFALLWVALLAAWLRRA